MLAEKAEGRIIMAERGLGPEEQSMLALHDLVLSTFKEALVMSSSGSSSRLPSMNAGSPYW